MVLKVNGGGAANAGGKELDKVGRDGEEVSYGAVELNSRVEVISPATDPNIVEASQPEIDDLISGPNS